MVIEKGRVITAIQVATDLVEPKTKEREIKGLVQSCLKFNLSDGLILTFDHTEQLKQEGVQVTVLPAWQYFLTTASKTE